MERGLNENTNGLIRQYIPKKSDFGQYGEKFIQAVQEKINQRPRKTLDFWSPNQVLNKNQNFITSCT
jgi:transposase, IS30 family